MGPRSRPEPEPEPEPEPGQATPVSPLAPPVDRPPTAGLFDHGPGALISSKFFSVFPAI